MHPVIFKIGWFEVHSFGLLLLISFLIGINLALRRAKKAGLDANIIVDLSIILIISGLVGARGMYVVYHLDEFKGRLFDIMNPIQSDGTIGIAGLTVLGGIILSIVCSILYLRYKKTSILPVLNTFAPAIALGFAVTRIGCFLHGCCFGTESSYQWAVTFPSNSPAGAVFPGLNIHPAQLYASFGGIVNFSLLLVSERFPFFKNVTFFSFLVLYGVSRVIVDVFRYYEESMILMYIGNEKISVNQGISFLLIIIGIIGIVYLSCKK